MKQKSFFVFLFLVSFSCLGLNEDDELFINSNAEKVYNCIESLFHGDPCSASDDPVELVPLDMDSFRAVSDFSNRDGQMQDRLDIASDRELVCLHPVFLSLNSLILNGKASWLPKFEIGSDAGTEANRSAFEDKRLKKRSLLCMNNKEEWPEGKQSSIIAVRQKKMDLSCQRRELRRQERDRRQTAGRSCLGFFKRLLCFKMRVEEGIGPTSSSLESSSVDSALL